MTEAEILAALRAELDAVLDADPWTQALTVHDDPGISPKKHAEGWVEVRLDLDPEDVTREALQHVAAEVDGGFVVVVFQPTARPAAELATLADAIRARYRAQCLDGVFVNTITPGSTVASSRHRGYRERVMVIHFTARFTAEVIAS